MQFHFGSGTLWGVPTLAAGTNAAIANPTPRLFATLQDISLDISFDVKELYGRKQFPDDIARGKGKITGKAKSANVNGGMLNDIFFGQGSTVGITTASNEEALTVSAGAATVANSANFLLDLGVKYVATGKFLQRVASAPTTGQYSVAAGVYTFNVSDNGLAVIISYTWNQTAVGTKLTITNRLMGYQPKFKAVMSEDYNGGQTNITLFQCLSSKLAWATKLDDYMIPEFDFSAFADASGNVIEISTSE